MFSVQVPDDVPSTSEPTCRLLPYTLALVTSTVIGVELVDEPVVEVEPSFSVVEGLLLDFRWLFIELSADDDFVATFGGSVAAVLR